VRHAVLLGRGERVEVDGALPAGPLPDGFVYVPPGTFLYGSTAEEALRRDMFKAPPQHPVRTAGFFIARTEVTFAEWLAYLRALPPAERAARLPRVSGERGGLAVTELPGGRFALSLQPTTQRYAAAEGEPIVYPGRKQRARQDWLRLPVSGVSWDDVLAYAAWRRAATGVRVRPCSEIEWERAARGADDRTYPHGDLLLADDANHDRTYGRDPLGFGPDEVGSHPASDSPFGVADLAGNVWEWVRSTTGEILIRGGSWYQEPLVSCATNRQVGEPTLRRVHIGLRLCADLP
jgi:formylglycine-generating enzyme required for sulfatase activity